MRSHFVDTTSGTFTLNIDSAGGVNLASAGNSYSGGTNLVAGEISTSPFTTGTIGSGTLTMGGLASSVGGSVNGNATLYINGGSSTIANAITTESGGGTNHHNWNGSGSTYTFSGLIGLGQTLILQGNTSHGNTLAFSNTISGTGGLTVNSQEPTVILSGTNTYTGTTTLSSNYSSFFAQNVSAFGKRFRRGGPIPDGVYG